MAATGAGGAGAGSATTRTGPAQSVSLARVLRCVAVVGKENNPLFLQALDGADHIVYHHIVHACLDIVGEKYQPRVSQNTDLYLGFLTPVDDCRVYGYVTNTQVKFILVTADVLVRDSDMSSLFKAIHAAYVRLTSNPFAKVGGESITSARFESELHALVYQYDSAFART